MRAGVADYSVDDFYWLARATLVKDERHIDRFDRVFATGFRGLEAAAPGAGAGPSASKRVRRCSRRRVASSSIWRFITSNGPYERVWTDNRRRAETSVDTVALLRSYGACYRAIFVGDAAMSPYELALEGGGVEHWNAEPGSTWITRLVAHWRHSVWLKPLPQDDWQHTRSVGMVRQLLGGRMFALTPAGLDDMARALMR